MAVTGPPLDRWRGASLAAQTGLMLLTCLVAAQWMTIWAFCDERAATLRGVAEEIAARELTLVAAAAPAAPAAWSREDLTIWASPDRPDALPPALAHLVSGSTPGAA
ncbi:MAG: hypothetical protein AAF390_15210, partial [Pseudomonadota bacterium]